MRVHGEGAGDVLGDGLASGFPAGQGYREDQVVVGGAAAPAEEFGLQKLAHISGDFEVQHVLFEEDAEVG